MYRNDSEQKIIGKKFEQWQDMISRLYPELRSPDGSIRNMSKPVTFQVTDACNLACSYCYQINKSTRKMKFEYAKKLIDMLLSDDPKLSGYIDSKTSPGIILEFIGGEPFLEVGLIDKICDYFYNTAIEKMHPWATRFCISICSNGVLYRTDAVQKFLSKWRNQMSFSVSIDGNKELHDACRVFPDGGPSYDIAIDAAKDWVGRGYNMGSKITLSPENIQYTYEAITHMVKLGYHEINANCVYEKGWESKHAKIFYGQLIKIADYWIDNGLVGSHYLALFNSTFFCKKNENDLQNWCGGTGMMLSMDPDGYLYPCIRYMESSLGSDREPLRIGHVDEGIAQNKRTKNCVECLKNIDRRSQSTDECFNCPIGEGCSWCSAYNYQVNGTPDSRCTYICIMHKARSLANAYFWNTWYKKLGRKIVFKMNCPKEWALDIISEEEYNKLLDLSKGGEGYAISNQRYNTI